MMRPRLFWPIVFCGLALCLAGGPPVQQAPLIGQWAWLAGCWESARGERQIEERTMLGMSRTVTGDRTSEFEHMQIQEQDGRLVLIAKPSGQQEASFRSISVTGSEVVFENAAHDFPQRIIDRRLADGSLPASAFWRFSRSSSCWPWCSTATGRRHYGSGSPPRPTCAS